MAGPDKSEILKMLERIIQNPPPPQTHCACGRTVQECDRDPGGVAACEDKQKARRS